MGSACVSVNIKEVEALAKKLKGYALTPAQENNLLKSLGVEIEAQISERIESTKRDPEGKTWAELADKTHFPAYFALWDTTARTITFKATYYDVRPTNEKIKQQLGTALL